MPQLQQKAVKKLPLLKPNHNSEFFRMLIYGATGVGKTRLACTACDLEDLKPVLMCDADLGLASVADRDFDVVRVNNMSDLEMVNNYIRAHPGEYRTVIVDSLTALYNALVRERLRMPGRTAKQDMYVPDQSDWLHGTFRMRLVIQQFKTAPVNFIATAMVDYRTDEATGVKMTLPGLSKKLAEQVGGEFDVVGFLGTKTAKGKVVRTLQIQPYGNRDAKGRIPASFPPLPPVLENCTVGGVYLHVTKGIEIESGIAIEETPSVNLSKSNGRSTSA